MSQTKRPKECTVHASSISTKAEEDEDHVASRNGRPAIEEDGAIGRDHEDVVPTWSMNFAPRVWVPWEGQFQVIVNHISFHGENG